MELKRGALSSASAIVFLSLAILLIPALGLQNDETLFANGIYEPVTVADALSTPAGPVPLMLVSYTGSLKTWIFALVFAFFDPSIWSIRMPVALLGAATVAIFASQTARSAGAFAGVVAGGLLATDPAFLLTTCFDWGPVALQVFLGVGAAASFLQYLRSDDWRWATVAGLGFGLALWNKALFLWTLGGLAAATLLIYSHETRRRAPRVGWALFAAGFACGAWPFLLYNLRTSGGTFAENVGWHLGAHYAWYKLGVLVETLDASALFGYMVGGDSGTATPMAAIFLGLNIAVLLTPRLRRYRPVVWTLAAFWAAYLGMFLGRDVGVGSHHVALLWPLPHLAIALAAGWWTRRSFHKRMVVLTALAATMSLNLRFIDAFQEAAAESGPSVIWTDAIDDLYAELSRMDARAVVFLDWGMLAPMRVLGQGRLPLVWGGDAFTSEGPDLLAEPGYVYVDHVAGKRVLPSVRERFDAVAQASGLVQTKLGIVRDDAGQPTFELFQVGKARTTAD